MKTKHSKLTKLSSATALTIIASFVFLLAVPATTLAGNECQLNQQQLQNQGAIPFGGRTVLGQTFIPSVAGQRVCQVKVKISKNVLAAGNLTLRLLRSNFIPLDAAVTINAAAIPMGNSVQVFNFGCNGAPLVGMPFYGLQLESSTSQPGAYSWRGNAGNPYVQPGNGGRGWRNVNAGAGNWISLGGWDYTFQIYLCD